MDSRKMIWAAVLTGIAAGVLLSPKSSRKSSSYRGNGNFSGKLNKELKTFDSAMKKQLKSARKEISQLVEEQYRRMGQA